MQRCFPLECKKDHSGEGVNVESLNEWMPFLETVGLPTTILLAFVWVSYKSIIWLGEYILIPITTKHIEFLKNVENSLKTADKFSQDFIEIQRTTFTRLDHMAEVQKNIETCLQTITQCEEKIISYVQVIQERMTVD